MGLLGRKITCVIVITAIILSLRSLPVQAEEIDYTPGYEEPAHAYVLRPAETGDAYNGGIYEVAEGDSLWKIADNLWGDGRLYPTLYELNKETVRDPNLIYPGEMLQTARPLYLESHGFSGMGIRDEFRFDAPKGCTFGYLEEGEAWASLAELGGTYDIACILQDKTEAQSGLKDFETWEREIRTYAGEEYGDRIQGLEFERYLAGDGGIVYLYSYIYTIDLTPYDSEGSIRVFVAAGVRQTEHMQAEFVGFTLQQADITDRVRYVAASFEELMPEDAVCTVNTHKMRMSPEISWKPASFNAMAWVDRYYDGLVKRVLGYEDRHKSRKEKILDQMKEGNGT